MRTADAAVLAGALRSMLPGPDETYLLRAILHRGASAQRAWDAFRGPERDLPGLFRTDTGNRKRLGPLLLASIRENELDAEPTLLTVLRTAALREELRVDAYRRIARYAYQALQEAAVPFVVMRGAALMETVYADAAWRHAHDIDLLLEDGDVGRAAEVLRGLGLVDGAELEWDQGLELRHATELPIVLLRRPFRIPFYEVDPRDVFARSRAWQLGELNGLRHPDATDALLIALVHASYCGGRTSLVWAVDAWTLLHGDDPVDWDAFIERTRGARAELPVSTLLDYLASELDAPVPDAIARTLTADVDTGRGIRRDVALSGVRRADGDHPDLEGRTAMPIGHRLTRLRWELLPSREYLAWAHGDPPAALLPLLYLTRPVAALMSRVRRRWARARRSRSQGGA